MLAVIIFISFLLHLRISHHLSTPSSCSLASMLFPSSSPLSSWGWTLASTFSRSHWIKLASHASIIFLCCRFIVSSRGSLGLPWQASRAISLTICSAPLLLAVLLISLSSSTGWPQPMWWMMWTPGFPLMWTWPSSARYMYSCIAVYDWCID